MIDALNQSFDCQVAAVHAHGGEVLKFIGDGMLAIFPLAGDVTARCSDAIQAAHQAQRAFAELRKDLAFGIALHVGEVSYGNIGGTSRLDFTAIGPAVNLAARLEVLTGQARAPARRVEGARRACRGDRRADWRSRAQGHGGRGRGFAPTR